MKRNPTLKGEVESCQRQQSQLNEGHLQTVRLLTQSVNGLGSKVSRRSDLAPALRAMHSCGTVSPLAVCDHCRRSQFFTAGTTPGFGRSLQDAPASRTNGARRRSASDRCVTAIPPGHHRTHCTRTAELATPEVPNQEDVRDSLGRWRVVCHSQEVDSVWPSKTMAQKAEDLWRTSLTMQPRSVHTWRSSVTVPKRATICEQNP